jgi:hypothetical protein
MLILPDFEGDGINGVRLPSNRSSVVKMPPLKTGPVRLLGTTSTFPQVVTAGT